MRILIILLAFVSLFLFACKKADHIANGNGQKNDTALANFIKATGITDATLKVNLDSLITRAKRHGWWDLCKVIYPLTGGTSSSCKYNLKDPRDSDSAYRLVFNGGTWTFDNMGVHPGSTGYANTFLNPSTTLTVNDCHLAVYSLDDVSGGSDNADIGCYQSGGIGFYLSARDTYPDTSGKPFANISNINLQGTTVNGSGFFLLTKSSSSSHSFYRGSSLIGSNMSSSTDSLPNTYAFLCNQNLNYLYPSPYSDGYSQRGLSFATIGSGINSTIEALMYSDINDFVYGKL